MQSAFWKAVALTGVIGVGCYVVYEVHRRMPKQQGAPSSANDFQGLGEQQQTAAGGTGAETGPLNELPPPGQQEPGAELTSNGSDPAGAAPWESISQRTDGETAARPSNFLDITSSSTTSGAASAGRGAAQPDGSAFWSNDNGATSGASTAEPLIGSTESQPAWADNETAPGRNADLSTAGGSASSVDNVANSQVEPVIGTSGVDREPPVRTREIRPASGTEFLTDSGTADPFANGATLEPAAGGPDAASNEPGPAELFGSSPEGPALEAAESADPHGAIRDLNRPAAHASADRQPGGSEPNPLPGLNAAPLAEGAVPDAAESHATFDPFPENGAPTLPPEGNVETPDTASSANSLPMENAGPAGNGLSAPHEFVPFDAAEPPGSSRGTSSATHSGVEIHSDTPAEFPVRSNNPASNTVPSAGDPAPFIISPARERRPDRVEPTQPAALPQRDFAGDGILNAQSPSGPQQPELKIEKVAPAEATVGDPLVYAIRVTNVGRSAAHDVIVEDRIPRGTTLDGTIPRAEMTDKKLLWRLGTIEPGGEQMIRIRVVPTEAGEIGSVATVRFVAEVAAATVITRPELSLEMSAPGEIAVGEQATFHFRVVNSGAADARDVIIRSLLPKGLEHPDGNDIEYPLGRLRAGEAREIELTVLAKEAGQLRSQGLVAIGSKTYAEHESPVLVIPSRLIIRREGPARRFVGRKADYTTTVTNRSSRDLQQVTVEEQLPPGLELAGMPQDGQFDARRRTITWKLPVVRAGESLSLKTSVVAQSPGTLESIVRASDAGGNKAALASRLDVAGFSALAVDFEHAGNPGPVSVGEQVSFRLTVKNRGTAPAEGVQALFEIPEHMEFVHADGPVAYTQEGQVIRFSTLNEIAAKDETSFNIVLTAAEAGTKRVTAELTTPTLAEPLRNDQAVVVEADE